LIGMFPSIMIGSIGWKFALRSSGSESPEIPLEIPRYVNLETSVSSVCCHESTMSYIKRMFWFIVQIKTSSKQDGRAQFGRKGRGFESSPLRCDLFELGFSRSSTRIDHRQ
jgi:hypothetical protein